MLKPYLALVPSKFVVTGEVLFNLSCGVIYLVETMGHFPTKFIDVAESCVVEVLSILCSFRRAHARRFPQTPSRSG